MTAIISDRPLIRSAIVLVAFFAAVSVNAQSGRAKPTPTPERNDDTVKIVTEEIKLNVLAFDEDGAFFKGVTKDDLVITENDVLHQPISVRRIPANVLIVMDTGGELRAVKSLDQTKKTARALAASLRPDDMVSVLEYSDKPELLCEWTDDPEQVKTAISHARFGRKSAFVDAVQFATDLLMKSGLDNKHLVLITDGTDSGGRSSDRFDAFQRLLGTDISVHVISYTRLESMDIEPRTKALSKTPPRSALPPEVAAQLPNGARDQAQAPKIGPVINTDRKFLKIMRKRKADLEVAEEELVKLSENTNGEVVLPETVDQMVQKTAVVAKMIDASYVVTYTPKLAIEDSGTERSISVTSKRPGLIVQSHRKFIVPSLSK